MTDRISNSELAELGYDPRWMEWGFLDPELFRAQLGDFTELRDFGTGDGLDGDHCRHQMFCRVLARTDPFSSEELERFLTLVEIDSDRGMAEGALGTLIRSKRISVAQLNELQNREGFHPPALQRLIVRRKLLADIASGELNDDLFDRCLASDDRDVQRELVSVGKLSSAQLTAIAAAGANRAIRNLAKEKLGRRKS